MTVNLDQCWKTALDLLGEVARYEDGSVSAPVFVSARFGPEDYNAGDEVGRRADRCRAWCLRADLVDGATAVTPVRGATVTRHPAGVAEVWEIDTVGSTDMAWAFDLVKAVR